MAELRFPKFPKPSSKKISRFLSKISLTHAHATLTQKPQLTHRPQDKIRHFPSGITKKSSVAPFSVPLEHVCERARGEPEIRLGSPRGENLACGLRELLSEKPHSLARRKFIQFSRRSGAQPPSCLQWRRAAKHHTTEGNIFLGAERGRISLGLGA